MVAQIPTPTQIEYPDSDGKPMSDNTKQFRWIVTIQGGLDAQYLDDPNVFVAGNLLWYPVAPAGAYELHVTVKGDLTQFADLVTPINLPYEYQEALLFNLGVRLRLSYQLPPDEALARLASASLETIRASNTQIPRLKMPDPLNQRTRFNIFSGM